MTDPKKPVETPPVSLMHSMSPDEYEARLNGDRAALRVIDDLKRALTAAQTELERTRASLACAEENFHVTNQAYVKADQELAKAKERCEAMIAATISHVDGRDLLAELHPEAWHFCDIRVRINGQWREFEGDWLKRLMKARDAASSGPKEG